MNGTYAWKMIAIENVDGRNIATINETFIGTTHWDHVARYSNRDPVGFYNIIPPSGRTAKIARALIELCPSENRRAYYDKTTGIFVGYTWIWPRFGTVYVTLKSTNVFSSVNVTVENGLKTALDLLLVAPFFALRLAGAIIGLS
jgi:hypothetical protein